MTAAKPARRRATPQDAAPVYEADTLYDVTLTRICEGPFGPLSPAHVNQIKGKHLAGLGDAVAEAVPAHG